MGKCVTCLSTRLRNHEYRARSGRDQTPKGDWVRQIQSQGLRPRIRLLEETTEKWQDAERRWIAKLRAEGQPLFNVHPGGNGAHTRAALAPEWVALLGKIADARIAEMAGLCRETITYHRRRAGIPASGDRSRVRGSFKKGHQTHNKVSIPDDVLALLGKRSDGELAAVCGVSRGLIKQRRKAAGITPCRPRGRHLVGSTHANAKVTEDIVRKIRAGYKPYSREFGCGALAKAFGLDPTTVHDIVKGRTWRHV